MSLRHLSTAIAITLIAHGLIQSPVAAQPADYANWQGASVPIAFTSEITYGDPYANVGVPSSTSWVESIPGYSYLPSVDSIPLFPAATTSQDRFWIRTEYLRWWTEGMKVPPLVTNSGTGTPPDQAGVIGQPGTGFIFGPGDVNGSSTGGVRLSSGFWFRPEAAFGIETEFFKLDQQTSGYGGSSDGSAILAIPYFDIVDGVESSQLVSYPGQSSGGVGVFSDSKLSSFLINGRAALMPAPVCVIDGKPDRLDMIVGYRYLRLDDRLGLITSTNSLPPDPTLSVGTGDRFETRNEFSGLQLGITYLAHFKRFWLDSRMRVGVGNNRQKVRISGGSTVSDGTTTDSYSGGLFAQRTNIGSFKRDEFTMVPELGLTAGIRVTRCFHATIGYNVLYLPNVVRAGQQIDRDLNPTLFAPPMAVTGPLRPTFTPVESDYWAHGLSFGGELNF